jgi:hypothetical protein
MKTKEDKGFALSDFLEPDDQETSKLKSIYNHEQEYSDYLGQIEYTIAKYYYYYGKRLTDNDVISTLEKINENHDRRLKYFQKTLENLIVFNLLDVLNDVPITSHELNLVIDYILLSIDNRSWMKDKQAFVKWAAYVFDLYSDEEKEDFENKIKDWLDVLGLPKEYLDAVLAKGGTESNADEKEVELTEAESQFFAMDDEEQIEYLIENPYERFDLLQAYIFELADSEELEKLDKFYNRFIEKHDDFYVVHLLMGIVYMDYDIDAAEPYLKKAKEKSKGHEGFSEDTKEMFAEDIEYLLEQIEKIRKGED